MQIVYAEVKTKPSKLPQNWAAFHLQKICYIMPKNCQQELQGMLAQCCNSPSTTQGTGTQST